MSESKQSNAQQADLWNDASGKAWVELQPVLDQVLEPFERLLADIADPGVGDTVLDVGCGAGATTMAMARRIGVSGHCTGLDISQPLVALATARAKAQGLANASFVRGDAQIYALDAARFDAVISRFGVMFFDDPIAAFANVRKATRSGGKLAFVAWRSPADNDFMTVAARAAMPLLPPRPAFDPDAPGQFAFADAGRVESILRASGWSAIGIERVDMACQMAEGDLLTYVTRMGPVGAALREVDEATAARVKAVLIPAFAPYLKDGTARFTAASWLVTAQS